MDQECQEFQRELLVVKYFDIKTHISSAPTASFFHQGVN